MKVLVVYAHNEPSSLTAALKNTSVSIFQSLGYEVVESDLYGQGFQPLATKVDFITMSGQHFNYQAEQKNASMNSWAFSPDITDELQKLTSADLLVIHFPLWWSGVPAILKGWFDRILVKGVAWDDHGQSYENGLLKGKRALLVPVVGGTREQYQPDGLYKTTLDQALQPVSQGTLAYCGLEVMPLYPLYGVESGSPESLKAMIDGYSQYLTSTFKPTITVASHAD